LRGKEGLTNIDGPWKNMITGAERPLDQERRKLIGSYIIEKLLSGIELILLQEVDQKLMEILTKFGCNVAYTQEAPQCNRGGCAIVSLVNSFENTNQLFCQWKKEDGTNKQKHIGTITTIKETGQSIASVHLDAKAAKCSLPFIEKLTKEVDIIGGDFNLSLQKIMENTTLLELYDETGEIGNIDFIFKTIQSVYENEWLSPSKKQRMDE
jgi:hypothetical protein